MKKNKVSLQQEQAAGTLEAGNTMYRVFVEDMPGAGVGNYTATTGPNHPAGNGRELLYGEGSGVPFSSYNTFRSYTTNTDYTVNSTSISQPPFTKVNIDSFGTISPIGTSGVRTTYVLPGSPLTPDALTIIQDVNVIGTTFENSYIEVRVGITNNGPVDTTIGMRYLWDTIIGEDDGPTFQTVNPTGPVLTNETEFTQPEFEAYQIVDNDENPNPPTYIVYGTVTGPENLGTGISPSQIKYVDWFRSWSTPFDYSIDPNRNISSPPENDSAVLYYWGHNKETAVTLDANGGSFSRVAALFATRPGIVPPFINNNICVTINRIFDVCRQEVTHTRTLHISSLKCGTYLGCQIKQAHCFVQRTSEPDTVATVEVQIIVKVDYKISFQGRVLHILKPLMFTATAQLVAPENTTVRCEIQNPTCESTPLGGGLIETTVHAFLQVESSGTELVVIPFVAGCPIGLCPNSIGAKVEDTTKVKDAKDDNTDNEVDNVNTKDNKG